MRTRVAAPGKNLFVADAYRCWVEEVSIGNPAGLGAFESLPR